MNSLIHWLVKMDKQVFLFINKSCSNPLLDAIMPAWRNQNTWIPLYILVLVAASIKLKKQVGWWLLAAIVTLILTDQISSHIIKPLFARPRPCSDVDFSQYVKLLLHHCSGGYSFTSSHACNHFGIALFFSGTLFQTKKNVSIPAYFLGCHHLFCTGICRRTLSIRCFVWRHFRYGHWKANSKFCQ